MAYDKVVDSAALDAELGGIANAIRAQTGGEEPLALEEMAAAIGGIKNADDYFADVLDKRVAHLVNHKVTSAVPPSFQNGNNNLVTVDLPNSAGVGESAFGNCRKLATVNLNSAKTLASSAFSNTLALKIAYFPSVETITGWGYMFNGSAVERVIFTKLKSQFRDGEFNNCKGLTALVLGGDAVVPLGNTSAFSGTPIKNGTGYIYVRASLLDAYRSASNWSAFSAQFRAIEDHPEIIEYYPGIMEV